MSERLSKLGITQKAIEASMKNYDSFGDDAPSLIRGVLGRMYREQQELYEYITSRAEKKISVPADLFGYGLGAALTYEMLPKSHTQNPLSTDEINAMHQTFVEYAETEVKDGQEETTIEWFLDRLKKDSPDFAGWLWESMNNIGYEDGKGNFLMGVIHVAVPFYMREEAKELDKKLFSGNEKSNKTDVNSRINSLFIRTIAFVNRKRFH